MKEDAEKYISDENIRITAVVCTDRAGAIGLKGSMPWSIEESKAIGEMQGFKTFTLNSVCICGRKTWESIPKKYLEKRHLIVITRNINKCEKMKESFKIESPELLSFSNSLEDAISKAKNLINKDSKYKKQISIIGGASIYKELINKNLANEFRISILNKFFKADSFFPLKDIFFNKEFEVLSCDVINSNHAKKTQNSNLLYTVWKFKTKNT